ncbi:MAG: hypothetical protein NUV54_02395 [Candidatus Taylorbacteria bacterium]|nr:hypothetical protein [Candidatus Taylorbacteria bacterium]
MNDESDHSWGMTDAAFYEKARNRRQQKTKRAPTPRRKVELSCSECLAKRTTYVVVHWNPNASEGIIIPCSGDCCSTTVHKFVQFLS